MSQPTTPRVFVSAVSSDLRSARKIVNDALTRIECLPVEESVFGTEYGEIREMIARKIDSCQAVIHLVVRDYGGEPDLRTLPAIQPRRSWTQLEYDIASEKNRKLYLLVCDDAFPFDAAAQPEAEDKCGIQSAHRSAVLADRELWHTVRTADELRQAVGRMKISLDEIRAELTTVDANVTATGRRLSGWLVLVVFLAVVVLGAVGSVRWRQQVESVPAAKERIAQQEEREKQEKERQAAEAARQKVQQTVQVQQEFADRFLLQLITNKGISPEEARQRALKELPPPVKLPMEEIQALIDRKLPAATAAAPVSPLDRARAALAQGKLDDVLQAADEQRQEGRELAMLEGTAALAKFRESPQPSWNERALAAFRRALNSSDRTKEPKAWTDAAIAAASLLYQLAKYSEAEPLLVDALAIREKLHGHDSSEVAVVLSHLAWLLTVTNRLAEAEPLMRRALAIDEQDGGADHPDVARALSSLAWLLYETNRRAEAEPLMRRALAIYEQSYGPEHPSVAGALNNLAGLLQATDRLAEAEPLIRRALATDEQSYGADHDIVGLRLWSLAVFLRDTKQLADAVPLMRRAISNYQHFAKKNGHEHPHWKLALDEYQRMLQASEYSTDEIAELIALATTTTGPLTAIVPEVERLLGPTKPVADVLAALDRQYKADGKPTVYFLPPDQPIAPHLDELLGKSKIDLPLDQPIAPQLDKLLGPAKSTKEVFEELDRQYREQNKPRVWFLPLSEPIAPHLDELLGPVPKADKE